MRAVDVWQALEVRIVKKLSLLLIASLVFASGSLIAGQSTKEVSPHPLGQRSIFSDRAIVERIKPTGSVCVEGEECGTAAAAVAAGPRSGDAVYNGACLACHASGAAGAPKVGDVVEWKSRIAKGQVALVKNAINGINAMPAKGMCMDCSDKEIEAAVVYMIDQSK